MLELKQIESFYPEYLRAFKRNLLREYLQYKILSAIFDSEFADKLSFLGGTAIHVIHSNARFSEDLDFDNMGLNRKNFETLTKAVFRKISLEGYVAEVENSFRGAYRSFIKIANILYENKLSGHKGEKMLIQIDAEPQGFRYSPDKVIIDKFDVFTKINVVPVDILLAQKIYAIFGRRRPMGRDFYDAIFLFGKTAPNFGYLRRKLNIRDTKELRARLSRRCAKLDFEQLAKDVSPFLFVPSDSKKVTLFPEYIANLS